MSRIGKTVLEVPDGVEIRSTDGAVAVKGPLGELRRTLPPGTSLRSEEGVWRVVRRENDRRSRANHGLGRVMVANMIDGVTRGHSKTLLLQGTGYRSQLKGKVLSIQAGYSNPVEFPIPEGIQVKLEPGGRVVVSGIDKDLVGQTAANIRAVRRCDPYKEKGFKYEGERVIRKEGKTGVV